MGGYFGNLTDDTRTQALMRSLTMAAPSSALRNNPGAGPTASVDIIVQGASGRQVMPAIWWLLLDSTEDGDFRPSRYIRFNTRSDKL